MRQMQIGPVPEVGDVSSALDLEGFGEDRVEDHGEQPALAPVRRERNRHDIALYEHAGATFKLQARNEYGCVDSNEVSVATGIAAAIGYIKASNTGANDYFGVSVALSANGGTLAVGAYSEDSNATGIDGDQSNNAASDSGAIYVY